MLAWIYYTTCYPEAVLLHNISARSIVEARFRLMKEIQTDQGISFMSHTHTVSSELYEILGIKSIHTCVYHWQRDGLVRRFHQRHKNMICNFMNRMLKIGNSKPFAVGEVLQASTRFSLFQLLCGHKPWGVFSVVWEYWEGLLSKTEFNTCWT